MAPKKSVHDGVSKSSHQGPEALARAEGAKYFHLTGIPCVVPWPGTGPSSGLKMAAGPRNLMVRQECGSRPELEAVMLKKKVIFWKKN
jgi:hypothetical protein